MFRNLIMIMALFFALPAWAGCDDMVQDDAHVLTDINAVSNAAKGLGNTGTTVRVRTVVGNLDTWIQNQKIACPNWRSNSGQLWKNNLIVFAYAPLERVNNVGLWYGLENKARLDYGAAHSVTTSKFDPAVTESRLGNAKAINRGMVETLTGLTVLMAPKFGNGNTTIHQATDFSGLWKVLSWIVAIGALVLAGILIWLWKRNEDDRKGAQAVAIRARSDLVSAVNAITEQNQLVILEMKVANLSKALQPKGQAALADIKNMGDNALNELNAFDSASGADPNKQKLPKSVYESNTEKYLAIKADMATAKKLIEQINSGNFPATFKKLRRNDGPAFARTDGTDSYSDEPAPISPAWNNQNNPAPQNQASPNVTIVNNQPDNSGGSLGGAILGGALGGFVAGEIMGNNRDRDRDRDREQDRRDREQDRLDRRTETQATPTYDPPAKNDDDDGGTWTASSDTSDGGSYTSDSSDGGGSFSSSDD